MAKQRKPCRAKQLTTGGDIDGRLAGASLTGSGPVLRQRCRGTAIMSVAGSNAPTPVMIIHLLFNNSAVHTIMQPSIDLSALRSLINIQSRPLDTQVSSMESLKVMPPVGCPAMPRPRAVIRGIQSQLLTCSSRQLTVAVPFRLLPPRCCCNSNEPQLRQRKCQWHRAAAEWPLRPSF